MKKSRDYVILNLCILLFLTCFLRVRPAVSDSLPSEALNNVKYKMKTHVFRQRLTSFGRCGLFVNLAPWYKCQNALPYRPTVLFWTVHYFPRGLRLPFQPQSVTTPWPVSSYTAWWQRHMGVNNLPKVKTRPQRCFVIFTGALRSSAMRASQLVHGWNLHCLVRPGQLSLSSLWDREMGSKLHLDVCYLS